MAGLFLCDLVIINSFRAGCKGNEEKTLYQKKEKNHYERKKNVKSVIVVCSDNAYYLYYRDKCFRCWQIL